VLAIAGLASCAQAGDDGALAMPTSVILLVIASAFMHSAWNAILKHSREPENAIVGMMTISAAASMFFAIATGVATPPSRAMVWILVSGVLEAGYFVTLARALSRAPLGSVYTVVRGGALVLVWPISVLLLGEKVSLTRAIGTALVVLGLLATGMSQQTPALAVLEAKDDAQKARHPSGKEPAADGHAKKRSGIAVAAFCACFVGGYHLAYKLALSSDGDPAAVSGISLSVAVIINIVALGQRRARAFAAIREQPIRIIIGGLLGGAGFLVFLSAMASAGAGVVLTLRNTSILFAQAFAFALGERPRRLALIGAGLVTAGAVLLAR
jgi:drug/metabolite transporter (DMT)-like permease